MLNEINGIMSDSAGNLANVGTYANDVIGYESGPHMPLEHTQFS